MKKLLLILTTLPLILSCNGQESKKSNAVTEKVVNQKKSTIQIDTINLNSDIDKILSSFGLNKNNNHNQEYNINLDYEEFAFSPDYSFQFNDLNIGKINSLMIYYLKDKGSAFAYELELENNQNSEALIAEFNKKLGKPEFYDKKENTKQHPLFLDENGEQETRHITEELMKWDDKATNTNYFVIYRNNLSSNENKLTVIAINKNHKKYQEWIKFRSLDMVFPK